MITNNQPGALVPAEENLEKLCRDCHQDFVITPGEQAFLAAKGFTLPVRCATCRALRRQQQTSSTVRPVKSPRVQPVKRAITALDEPPAPTRNINCSACGQPAVIPGRSKKQKKAKCQPCLQKEIKAWLKKRALKRLEKAGVTAGDKPKPLAD